MSEQENHRSKEYKRARDNFEGLPFEEKAAFLLEAVFATVTRGIEKAGKAVSEELDTVFKQAQEAAERAARQAKESDDDTTTEAETGSKGAAGTKPKPKPKRSTTAKKKPKG